MPLHQQDADERDHHPPKVGATVSGKDQAPRVVPEQKAQSTRDQAKRQGSQNTVAHLQRNVRQRKADEDRHRPSQTVVAANAVEGIREAHDGQYRQRHAQPGHGGPPGIEPRQSQARHRNIQQCHRQRTGQARQQQPPAHGHALGRIFCRTHQHHHRHHQKQPEVGRPVQHNADEQAQARHHGRCCQSNQPAHQHAQAPQPRHSTRMKALRHVGRVMLRVPAEPAPHQKHSHQRNKKT